MIQYFAVLLDFKQETNFFSGDSDFNILKT